MNNHNSGLGLTSVLTLIFVVLKLVGTIDWNWWWVLSPLLIDIGIVFIVSFVCAFYVHKRKKKRAKRFDQIKQRMMDGTMR